MDIPSLKAESSGFRGSILAPIRAFFPVLNAHVRTRRWLYSHQNEPCTDCFAAHLRTFVSCAPSSIGDKSIHVGSGGAVTLVYSNTHKTQPLAFRFENTRP